MATFLLEIGTEELPADFARLALPQLEDRARRDLGEARVEFGDLHATSTPRRLALLVENLAARQADRVEERKGPPAQQAFHAGVPTAAAAGFARRCGVAVEALEVRDTDRGPFTFARVHDPGRPVEELLSDLVPEWIWGLQGRRFMRWGEGSARFSRPVRWLVALLDREVVPLRLEGCDPSITSGRLSRGHRLRPDGVAIATADAYAATLAAVDVQVERSTRAEWIRTRIDQAATAEGGARADLPGELFDELVDLVESPQLVTGAIEERFLALPPEVLRTVMRSHQRYVPLLRSGQGEDPLALEARQTLVPRFLCVANGRAEAQQEIRRGNERVLRARLADAEFFVQTDRRTASIDRRDLLHRVTFAEGLGSLRDRSDRLEWFCDVLLERLPLAPAPADHARRAAHLCKHDLVSQMVGEFPELQGVMGAKYLLAEGEPPEVALAVLEHYLPRTAGGPLPTGDPGAVVALAERLELLLSIYATGERPSGSSDPYALRRAGNGLLQILWDRGWQLDLNALLARATHHWADIFPDFHIDPAQLTAELGEFLRQRIASLLEELRIDADLVQAVAGPTVVLPRLLSDPADARRRADLLGEMRRSGTLEEVQAVVIRASRLAEKGELDIDVLSPNQVVDPTLFTSACEQNFLTVLQGLEPLAKNRHEGNYNRLAQGLTEAAKTLADFFDGEDSVLVMSEDLGLRRNRLNLLSVLRNQAFVLGDFTCLNG